MMPQATILAVDDDPSVLAALRRLLRPDGALERDMVSVASTTD